MVLQKIEHGKLRTKLNRNRTIYAFEDDLEDERGVRELCTVVAEDSEIAIAIGNRVMRFENYNDFTDTFKRIENWKKAKQELEQAEKALDYVMTPKQRKPMLERISRHEEAIVDGVKTYRNANRCK